MVERATATRPFVDPDQQAKKASGASTLPW